MVAYGLWLFRIEIVNNLEFFVSVDSLCYRIELGLKLTGVDRKLIFFPVRFFANFLDLIVSKNLPFLTSF